MAAEMVEQLLCTAKFMAFMWQLELQQPSAGVSDPVHLGGHCAALGWLLILSGRATVHGCGRGHCGSRLVAFLQRMACSIMGNPKLGPFENEHDQTTQLEIFFSQGEP